MRRVFCVAAIGLLCAVAVVAEIQPAVVYDVGSKFDKSFNEGVYNGAERFKEETGIAYAEFQIANEAQREQAFRNFARRGYSPIIAVGFSQAPAVEAVAAEYPDTSFAIIDMVVELPNVQSIVFKEHEASFLVGMIAAMASETGTVGFVGGMDIPLIRRFACGYVHGVRYVNPDAEIYQNMAGSTPAAWSDPVKGAELAKSQFDRGADVVFAAAGATGLGVLQAAADGGKLSIGVDSNQNHLHPGSVLTSMLKRVDVAAYDVFKTAMDGTWEPGFRNLGLAEDGVGWGAGRAQPGPDQRRDDRAGGGRARRHRRRRDGDSRLHGDQLLPLAPQDRPPAVTLRGINKRFGTVQANRDVSLEVAAGAIHGIVGENGAGKSTLMSILYGFYRADSGTVEVEGRPVAIASPRDAIAAGIGMVHQHFMLVEPLTVLENVLLGAEGAARLQRGLRRARDTLNHLARDYGLEVDVDAPVGDLPVGIQQRVEILKALYRGAETLILDEPTGVLTPQEADELFRILAALKQQGRTMILITHKLREIMAVTDRVTVMRRGEVIAHVDTATTSQEHLAELMVGRTVLLRVEKSPATPGELMLQGDHLDYTDAAGVRRVRDVSLSVRRGEIVGIAGVAGNGQSELMALLAGIERPDSGTVTVNGRPVCDARDAADARRMRHAGLGHVPEDRQRMGLVGSFAANESSILGYHDDPAYNGTILMHRRDIIASSRRQMNEFDVRPPDPLLRSSAFSGGNQQKIIVARELDRDPDVLLIGQPTRGLDIGAIEFIHRRLLLLRDRGMAILLVSVELDEIIALSDRVLVMFDGAVAGEVTGAEATEQTIGPLMAGVGAAA